MVQELHESYNQIFSKHINQPNDGSMLLRALDGLFVHIFNQYSSAMTVFARLNVPKSWRKVDVVREAGSMQVRL